MSHSIDWNDPAARLRLAERIGPQAYNEAQAAHLAASTVATVNGYAIRPVQTRFGRLFAVSPSRMAFRTKAEAEAHARTLAPAVAK